EPVHGGVRIAVANRFVERGDDVVVLLAGLVVQERAPLDERGQAGGIQPPRSVRGGGGRGDGLLEQIERDARVAVGIDRERRQRVVVGRNVARSEAAPGVFQRAPEDRRDVGRVERQQHVDLRSREQRR